MRITSDPERRAIGRTTPFKDNNAQVHDALAKRETKYAVVSLEMETFTVFHLAHVAEPIDDKPAIIPAAACIVVADRERDEFVRTEEVPKLELMAGRAVLKAMTQFKMSWE